MNREKRRLEQETSELRRKIKEFDDQLSEIMTSEDGDLEDELDQTKLRLEKDRLELQVKEANKFTYAQYIKEIDDMVDTGNKSSCPTCNRAFKNEGEARELKADLEEIIAKIPSKVNSLRSKVVKGEKRLEELQVLLPTKRQVDEHRAAVQTKERRIAEIARAKKESGRKVREIEEELEANVAQLSACNGLRDPVSNLDQLLKDVAVMNSDIRELQGRTTAAGDIRSAEEFKKEDESVRRKLKALNAEVDAKERRATDVEQQQLRLQQDINALDAERLEIEKRQQGTVALQEKQKEMELKFEALKKETKEADAQVDALDEDIDAETREKNRLQSDKNKILAAAKRDLDALKADQMDLAGLEKDMEKYRGSGNEANIEEHRKKIAAVNRSIGEKEQEKARVEREKSELEAVVNNHDKIMWQFNDLLSMRAKKRDAQAFEVRVPLVPFVPLLKPLALFRPRCPNTISS